MSVNCSHTIAIEKDVLTTGSPPVTVLNCSPYNNPISCGAQHELMWQLPRQQVAAITPEVLILGELTPCVTME